MTSNISLSQQIPTVGVPIEEVENYEAELWLHGDPLPAQAVHNLLSLAESTLPDGEFGFDHDQDIWRFRSFSPLTDDEKCCVQNAANKVGLVGLVDFVVIAPPGATPPTPRPDSKFDRFGNFDLIASRHLKQVPGTFSDLIHRDEDEWRAFLSRRATREIVMPDSPGPSQSACLYDVEHSGDSRLSELLTLYDRVDITPHWCPNNYSNKINWLEFSRFDKL